MDFKKHGIIYVLIIVVIVLFLATRLFPHIRLTDVMSGKLIGTPSAALKTTGSSVVINFGDSQKTYTTISATTVYLALLEAAKQDKLDIAIRQYQFGIGVEKIDALANTAENTWIYSVNGQIGDVPADKKVL